MFDNGLLPWMQCPSRGCSFQFVEKQNHERCSNDHSHTMFTTTGFYIVMQFEMRWWRWGRVNIDDNDFASSLPSLSRPSLYPLVNESIKNIDDRNWTNLNYIINKNLLYIAQYKLCIHQHYIKGVVHLIQSPGLCVYAVWKQNRNRNGNWSTYTHTHFCAHIENKGKTNWKQSVHKPKKKLIYRTTRSK